MDTPPAVVVHSLADMKCALAAGRPVLLLSGAAAALYGGCGWWLALLAAAGFEGPSLLDCGDAPGRAVEAIRLGVPGVVLDCEATLFAQVAALAAAQRAVVRAARPPALDLAERGAERRLATWLAAG